MITAPTAGVSDADLSLSPPACMDSFSVAAEIAVSWAAIALVPRPQTTHVAWRTCVYLPAHAVHTKRLNKVADAVRRLEIHA